MAGSGDSKWLDDFAKTPEGKVAAAGVLMCTIPPVFPNPLFFIGAPLVAVGLIVHGVRKLAEK
jgi:hypothetical protein